MKIIINEPIASASWSYRKGDQIDTQLCETISEEQALSWLNAGIAEVVKEPVRRKGKKEQS